MVDYRGFRLSRIKEPRFSHVPMLLFWPAYGAVFALLESMEGRNFHPVSCPLDGAIPFCEYFIFPYWFWFVFMIGTIIYLFFFDARGFRRFMYFTMVTYAVTVLAYIFWPTMQTLRPAVFPRQNFCTGLVGGLYAFDTNTNVCPSIHVLGSLASVYGAWHSPRLNTPFLRGVYVVCAFFISISTVFLKQHSVVDVVCALALSLAALPVARFLERRFYARLPAEQMVA